jgi:hypothetical protein
MTKICLTDSFSGLPLLLLSAIGFSVFFSAQPALCKPTSVLSSTLSCTQAAFPLMFKGLNTSYALFNPACCRHVKARALQPATLVFCQKAQSGIRTGKRRTSESRNLARVQAFNHLGEGRDAHDLLFGWFLRAFSGRADADAACTQVSKILL